MKINHLNFGFNRQQLGLDHQQFLSNKAMEVHGSTFRLRASTEMPLGYPTLWQVEWEDDELWHFGVT